MAERVMDLTWERIGLGFGYEGFLASSNGLGFRILDPVMVFPMKERIGVLWGISVYMVGLDDGKNWGFGLGEVLWDRAKGVGFCFGIGFDLGLGVCVWFGIWFDLGLVLGLV